MVYNKDIEIINKKRKAGAMTLDLIKKELNDRKIDFIEQNTKFNDVIVIRKNGKFVRITLCNYTDLTHNYHICTIDKEFYVSTQKDVLNFFKILN